jgi:CRISPR-associated protein Cmr6
MSPRRSALAGIKHEKFRATANAGLWLQKFFDSSGEEDKDAKRRLVQQTANVKEPPAYGAFYNRWVEALKTHGAQTRTATASGRMIVGLGDESVLEASVTLHHTYGVPYIPGSALKGLTASYARQQLCDRRWNLGGEYYNTLFGDNETAGYLTFFDAMYIPGSGHRGQALYSDVLTVHHQQYYQDGSVPPADWDSPVPVPFLSATGKYLIALATPKHCEEWLSTSFLVLEAALKEVGVGAKTSSGYGRMSIDPPPIDPDQQKADELIRDIDKFPVSKVAGEIGLLVDRWRKANLSPPQRRRVAEAILGKNREAGREKAVRDQDWYNELKAAIDETS